MSKKTACPKRENWHRADIVAALKKVGWSVRALSRAHGLHQDTLGAALVRPYPHGERIIAEALGVDVAVIWPQRVAARNFQPQLRKAANA